jgi:hypothetical protein
MRVKVTKQQIDQANSVELANIREGLQAEKMKLDKFFTAFLANTKLDENDLDNPDWTVYHEMLKDYDRASSQIQYVQYRLRNPSFAK